MNTQLNAAILRTPLLKPLRVSQFMHFTPGSTPGNVGIAISGGSSRSMIAGMGQLRGLKALQNSHGSILAQTRAISAVSGGSWLTVPFMYLCDGVTDDEFLGIYQDPSVYTPENLQQLSEGNIGRRCTNSFSAKDLAFEALLLIIAQLPNNMVWQTLIGIHILKFYNLYTQSSNALPADFFSYDNATLKTIIDSNPSLADLTAYVVATRQQRVSRPYFICNASMFVDIPGEISQSLVPVQITPFFTGIFGIPPYAQDTNYELVGGGGVESFAFNSKLQTISQQNVTVIQDRQFSLTDAAGTSSSFFAEYIEELASLWHANLKHFFADNKNNFTVNRWQHIIDSVPKEKGEIIYKFLVKLENLKQYKQEIGNEELIKADFDPGILRRALKQLCLIVPEYYYWPINDDAVSSNTLENAFADGGNLENTGINALLLYEDIDRIISFINSSTPLTQVEYGIVDDAGNQIPNTCIKVDAQIPPLFGYQPYNDQVGYKLYSGDLHPSYTLFRYNQVFPSAAFAELLQGLWEVSGNKAQPGSNQHAANYLQNLTTVKNDWFGIEADKEVQVLWVYNNFINDWYEQLSPEVKQSIFNNDPTNYYSFPHYSTLDTQLTPAQINLLASQTSWSVLKASEELILNLYQQNDSAESAEIDISQTFVSAQ